MISPLNLPYKIVPAMVHFTFITSPNHLNLLFRVIFNISGMSIVSFIIKQINFSDRNVMLRSVSDRIDGGSPGVCVWEIGQVLPGLCFFPLGNPSVVQTWAGTDRVDVSVQLLVSFIIVLRYKCRP